VRPPGIPLVAARAPATALETDPEPHLHSIDAYSRPRPSLPRSMAQPDTATLPQAAARPPLRLPDELVSDIIEWCNPHLSDLNDRLDDWTWTSLLLWVASQSATRARRSAPCTRK